jgi:hypothetical protein
VALGIAAKTVIFALTVLTLALGIGAATFRPDAAADMKPARRRRCKPDTSNRCMSILQAREAQLLVKVERAKTAFRAASDDCRQRHQGNVRECLKPVARNYSNALQAFSALVLDGKAIS